jgi:hypothetical protein
MVRQVNIHMMTLIRRSHLIVRSPVAAAGAAGAAWSLSITMLASEGSEEEAVGAVYQDRLTGLGCGRPVGQEVEDLAGVALAVGEVGPVGAPDEAARSRSTPSTARRPPNDLARPCTASTVRPPALMMALALMVMVMVIVVLIVIVVLMVVLMIVVVVLMMVVLMLMVVLAAVGRPTDLAPVKGPTDLAPVTGWAPRSGFGSAPACSGSRGMRPTGETRVRSGSPWC